MFRCGALSALCLIWTALCLGQSGGEVAVHGYVTDESGGGYRANVQLIDKHGEIVQETRARQDGRYEFACLEDGLYSLRFEAEAFFTETVSGIRYEFPAAIQIDRQLMIDKLRFRTGDDQMLIIVVKDASGRLLDDRHIALRAADGSLVGQAFTSSCGRVSFEIDAGDFGVEVEIPHLNEPFKTTLEYKGGRSTKTLTLPDEEEE